MGDDWDDETKALYRAAMAVTVWANELGYYAEDGTVLAPVLARLKTAVDDFAAMVREVRA